MKFSIATKSNGNLCKIIKLENGKIDKQVPTGLCKGKIECGSKELSEIPELLSKLKNNQGLVHGIVIDGDGKEFFVNSVGFEDESKGEITKTLNNFKYSENNLSMLDYDLHEQCPHPPLNHEELLHILGKLDRQWQGVGTVLNFSTSAGLMINGKPFNVDADGFHLYFEARNAEHLRDYMEALFKLSVIAGHGWIQLSKVGTMLLRSCFDKYVYSPERLDFTSPPKLVGKEFTQKRPEPKYKPGGTIDCSMVPEVDEAEYEKAVAALKGDTALDKKVKAVQVSQAKAKAKERKISIKAATELVMNQANGVLNDSDIIIFKKHGEVSVANVLKNPERYNKEYCADIAEPEHGTSKAMFFANEGVDPLVHSFLHGGIVYRVNDINYKYDHNYVKMLNDPIDPNYFRHLLKKRILDLEPRFTFGPKMEEGFQYYGATFNKVVRLNSIGADPTRLVIPAPTGGGKSVSSQLYLSKMEELGLSGLLVVGKISTAIEATREMNKLAGKRIAACTYFPTNDNPETEEYCKVKDLKEFPVIVITHSMFITRSSTLNNIDEFKLYKKKQRHCVIIDEAIDFHRTVSFTNKEIKGIKDYVSGINHWEVVSEILDTFQNYKPQSMADTARNSSVGTALSLTMMDIRNGKGTVGMYHQRKDDPEGQLKRRRAVVSLLDRMTYVLNGKNNIITSQGNTVTYSRNLDLTNQFGSCVILDATASITPIYDAHASNRDDIKNFIMPDGIRNYSNVTLNVCRDSNRKQSKRAIVDQHKNKKAREQMVDDYLEELYKLSADGSKVLVVLFQAIEEMFRTKCQDPNIEFIHYGEHEGRNDFSAYSKAVAIGWYRKSETKYLNDIDAIQINTDNYQPLKGTMQRDVRLMIRSGVAADMVQFFNRTRSRISIDKDGNCEPVDFYIFDDGTADNPVSLIRKEMSGIKVKDWTPVKMAIRTKKTKMELKAERVIKYLLRHSGCNVTMGMVADHMGCGIQTVRNLAERNLFKELLEEEDILFIRQQGKTGGSYFVVLTVYEPKLETEREREREMLESRRLRKNFKFLK